MMNAAQISAFVLFLLGVVAVTDRREIQTAVAHLARGIRNNNPGNIKLTDIEWRGKVPREQNTDGEFEQFYYPVDGIRAIARDLKTDYSQGLDTIRKLITEWSATDREPYIAHVSAALGIDADRSIAVTAHLYELVDAIIVFENGSNPYPEVLVLQGVAAA